MSAQVVNPLFNSFSSTTPLHQACHDITLPWAGEATEHPMSCQSIANSLRSPGQIKMQPDSSADQNLSKQTITARSGLTVKRGPDPAVAVRLRLGKRASGSQNITQAGPRYRSSISSIPNDTFKTQAPPSKGLAKHLRPKLTIQVPPSSRPPVANPVAHTTFAESKQIPFFTRPSTKSTTKTTRIESIPKSQPMLDKSLPASPSSTPPLRPLNRKRLSYLRKSKTLNKSLPDTPSSALSIEMVITAPETQHDTTNSSAIMVKAPKASKAARILGVSQDVLDKEEAAMKTFFEDTSGSESDEDLIGSGKSRASSRSSLAPSSRSSTQSAFQRDDPVFRKQLEPYYLANHDPGQPKSLNRARADLQPSPAALSYQQSQLNHRSIPRSAPTLVQSSDNNRTEIDSEIFSLGDVPITPPAVPKKSEKRPCVRSKKRSDAIRKAVAKALAETKSSGNLEALHPVERVSARPLSLAVRKKSELLISAEDAERIILRILGYCHGLRDLGNTAQVNQGFYTIFRRHQLDLIKQVLRNDNPAAFELRETSPMETVKGLRGLDEECTASHYLQLYSRDESVISSLKSLIHSQCQSYLRPETLVAFENPNSLRAKQIDNAFWRLWTFCAIFGSGRGREDDIVGQMDWLDGGFLAHQSNGFCATGSEEAFQNSTVLLRASDTFGCGNKGGLTAEELYDMTEIWNCLKAILNGILGEDRVEQARKYGVFSGRNVKRNDASATEGNVLEEWMHHLSTLGLSVILSLALQVASKDDTVFQIAHDMGWTKWNLPENEFSKSIFLKEAVARVYQERMVAAMVTSGLKADESEKIRVHRKQRSAELAAELKKLKSQGDLKRVIQSQERCRNIWIYEDSPNSIMPEAAFSSSPLAIKPRRSRAKSFGESSYWPSIRSTDSTASPSDFDATISDVATIVNQNLLQQPRVQAPLRPRSQSFNANLPYAKLKTM